MYALRTAGNCLPETGTRVPVSGKQFAAVRNAYMSYRLGEV